MNLFLKSFLFAFILLLLCWGIQLENSIQFIAIQGGSHFNSEIASFLISQQQNLLFFGLNFLLFFVLFKLKTNRLIPTFIVFVLGFYLILNQLFYQLYFNHFHFNFDIEGQNFGIAPFLDSILSIIDFAFYMKFFLLLLGCIVLYRIPSSNKKNRSKGKRSYGLIAVCVVFVVYGFTINKYEKSWRSLEKNPLFSLILGKNSTANNLLLANKNEAKEVTYTLKYGVSEESDYTKLIEYAKLRNQLKKKPNVIYFVLESVGAYNLLVNGNFTPSLTPNLVKWQKNSLLFNRIYNTFPGTTRSHIPIHTGGKTITWGNVQDEMQYDYTGATLTKSLKKKDYSTALFSTQFLEYGELLNWYNQQEFDLMVNPDSLPENFIKKHHLNSWGITEEAAIDTMNQWIKNYNPTQPFFIEFMNSGTHHPYSVPPQFKPDLTAENNILKHQKAIQYIDSLIGLTIETLQQKGILENTIICISGDHGQAFGKRHYENQLHKNYIYEENIRNFFLIIDPTVIKSPIVSNRSGSIGDIMPTILSLTDNSTEAILGQNMFDSSYKERIHYFHKNSYPELWGLVDGKWKFIQKKIGQSEPQLFDLQSDEGELNNLAKLHPEKVSYYQDLLPNWYLETNRTFRSELLEFKSPNNKELTVNNITTEGIQFLEFVAKGKGKEFINKERFHPKENIIVWLQTSFFPENKQLEYRWTSPSGKVIKSDLYFDKDWVTYWRVFERKGKLEEGRWTCGVYDGQEELISNTFEVSAEEPLLYPYIFEPGPVELLFGVKTESGYVNLKEMHPEETIIAFAQINPYSEDKELLFEWESPSLEKFSYVVDCKTDWNYTWLVLSEGEPMEEGIWRIKVSENGEKLIESNFTVSSAAKLYQPISKNF